jgi:hypothetical protein
MSEAIEIENKGSCIPERFEHIFRVPEEAEKETPPCANREEQLI